MQLPLQQPLAPPAQLIPWLRGVLPGFQYTTYGAKVVVRYGFWTQVLIVPEPNGVDLALGLPVVPRLMLSLGFLAGILPGLVFSLVLLTALSTRNAVRDQLAAALTGRPIPPGPGLPGAPSATPARPKASVSVIAPAWMPMVAVALLGGAITGAAVAYDGLDGYLHYNALADRDAKHVAILQQSVERARLGKQPPEGCPERDLRPPVSGCYGCFQFDTDPSGAPLQGYKRYHRANDSLDCPLPKKAAEDLARVQFNLRADGDIQSGDLLELGLSVALGGIAMLGALGLFALWVGKNKTARAKRREELAALAPPARA